MFVAEMEEQMGVNKECQGVVAVEAVDAGWQAKRGPQHDGGCHAHLLLSGHAGASRLCRTSRWPSQR